MLYSPDLLVMFQGVVPIEASSLWSDTLQKEQMYLVSFLIICTL
jgi:hypothetical protein